MRKKRDTMKRKYLLIAILVAAVIFAKGQTATITLNESIETALKNNIEVKQRELLKQSANINYRQAKNNMLPVVQSQFNYGINNGRSIDPFTNGYVNQQLKSSDMSVQGSLPVFSGFQLKNAIKQNELAFAGATMEWQQRKDELTLQVILAYLQVLNNQDAITLAKQQAEVSRQQVERLEIVNSEGATAPGNFYDLKGQYAGDQLALVNAENNYASSVLTLTQLMNVPYNNALVFDRTGVAQDIREFVTLPEEIYAVALQKLAAVKASELRISSSTAAVKVANAARFPTVSLFGGASTNYSSAAMLNNFVSSTDQPNGEYVVYNGSNLPVISKQDTYKSSPISYSNQFNNNISTGFGVSVRIPIFNSFRTRAAVQLARNEEKNFRLIADNIKLQLRQAIELAYVNIQATYKRYQAVKNQADAYAESFRIAAIRFENGVINSPEYLIAKNNFDRANANLINVQYEYLLRNKILDFYMGRLN
jgi:outer membrane protein